MSWTEDDRAAETRADLVEQIRTELGMRVPERTVPADAEPRDEPVHGRCRNDFLCCYDPNLPCFLTRTLWPMRPERAAVTYGATGHLAPAVESPWDDPRR